MIKYFINKNFILSAIFIMSGCSTFETRDIYAPVGKEAPYVEYQIDETQLRIGFDPDTRFYSIGVLGIPIIPTYIDTSDAENVALTIGLELRKNSNFSFDNKPCAITEDSESICPYMAEVSAIALYQDDGSAYPDKQRRWSKISQFYNLNNRILNIPITKGSLRINRDTIYDHYGYENYPKWDLLRIDIKYKYRCEGDCPKQLTIDTIGLVSIDNTMIPEETILFSKTKEEDYHFTRPIQ